MNTDNLHFSLSQELLLNMLSSALFDNKTEYTLNGDVLPLLFAEAQIQAVDLIAFSNEKLEDISTKTADFIKNKLNIRFVRNISINNAHIKLHTLLSAANIPYVILKGLAASDYYPDPMLRSMGDVDFLIKSNDIEKVDKLFAEHGITSRKKDNDHHITYDGVDARYELHFSPPGIPEGKAGELILEMFSDILDKRIEIETELGSVFVPSEFHHGLVLLLHTVHHLTGDGLGLRHLCDWAVFLSKFNASSFAAIFENRLKSVGLWQFALVLSDACCTYLGCPLSLGADTYITGLSRNLIFDIFSSGNFGQKNEDRSHESLLIAKSSENSSTRPHFMFLQIIKSINNIVYNNWRFVRIIKVFLPIGWIFFGGRYIIRSILGKRPAIHVKSVFSEAQSRIGFYNKLHIFEIDK